MKKIQVTLTVEEGKEIISLGILNHPTFKSKIDRGKILFKGGTTVSKITEKLLNTSLRISGRITSRGTVSSLDIIKGPHSLLYEKGQWRKVDQEIVTELFKFGPKDLIICGANAFDNYGKAAMMAGSPGGGLVGQSLAAWYTEGAQVIIPVGLEKMVPGDLDQIISRSSRRGKSISWGMAVGLLPLQGQIFTEIEAIKTLADVDCFPLGAGGLGQGQGSSTLEIHCPSSDQYNQILEILKRVKSTGTTISGIPDSLIECQALCDNCKNHIGCGYKSQMLV